jgi:two-component system alkaline phosphatase synthesis response regulator PhoP
VKVQQTHRILLIEDEKSIGYAIQLNFELEGFQIQWETNGVQALKIAQEKFFDLMVVDVMLPDLDGISLCETLRLQGNQTPILFLSAKGEGKDRIEGLKAGGNDYMAKPFEWEELLLRCKNLIQIKETQNYQTLDQLEINQCMVYFNQFEVVLPDGTRESLTKRECMLLKLLVSHPGEAVTREEILDKIWGYDALTHNRTIDNVILHFRKIFESQEQLPKRFFSVRGVGYKFL